MATLLVIQDRTLRAGQITNRVVIGRWTSGQVVINDRAVSRIHAWISQDPAGEYFVVDASSRTGTFLNGTRITGRHHLASGDVIRVGRVEVKLLDDHLRPPGLPDIDLSARDPDPPSPGAGIMIDCPCGAPIWVPWYFAGRTGACKSCGELLSVPVPAGAPSAAPAPAQQRICGACHGPLLDEEESTSCPDCKTPFHVECWAENLGCSTYGCQQVNVLAPATSDAPFVATGEQLQNAESLADTRPSAPPWDYLLLAGGVLAALVGVLAFGAPAFVIAALALLRVRAGRAEHRGVVISAAAFAILGGLAGVGASYIWWIGPSHHAH